MPRKRSRITRRQPAGPDHQVVTVKGASWGYRREPCEQCPWRIDQTGGFPAEAFVLSAHTAYDAAVETFACHMSGQDKPATCAGFLLQNAEHNLLVRLRLADGRIDPTLISTRVALHKDYVAMAIANGVPADHPALNDCRGNDD